MDGDLLLKFVTAFLTPLGLALLLALLGLALNRRWLVLVALAWLWLWSTPWSAQRLAGTLEHRHPLKTAAELPPADAIVLLGGALHPSAPGRPQINLGSGSDRLVLAAQLYRAGKAPRILYSGGSLDRRERVEAEDGALLLQQWGVPEAALLLETASRTTRDNARYSLPLLRQLGARRVLLVTTGWHLPRALRNFRQATAEAGLDIEFIAAACDPVEIAHAAIPALRYLPNSEALHVNRSLFNEYLGLLHARIAGS